MVLAISSREFSDNESSSASTGKPFAPAPPLSMAGRALIVEGGLAQRQCDRKQFGVIADLVQWPAPIG